MKEEKKYFHSNIDSLDFETEFTLTKLKVIRILTIMFAKSAKGLQHKGMTSQLIIPPGLVTGCDNLVSTISEKLNALVKK